MQKKETKITIPEDTRLISFLGGKTIIYILSALILIGILIFTMDTISSKEGKSTGEWRPLSSLYSSF